jgi:arylsulfatase A-like enzyme
MCDSPFAEVDNKSAWNQRLQRLKNRVLKPLRPSRINPDRPGPNNLLLLGIDTLRADHLGLGGYSLPTSAHLDRLASLGTIFSNASATSPWTLPSFSSALTSVMPGLHGGYLAGPQRNMDNQPPRRLDDGIVTLASHLRDQGYRTAAFYSNQFFAFGLAESFDHHSYHNVAASDLAAIAMEWVRRHADEPFFCFVLFNDPHAPTTPPANDLAPFLTPLRANNINTNDETLTQYVRWGEKPGLDLGRQSLPLTPEALAARDTKVALYDGAIAYVDRTIATMQQQLEHWAMDSKTLVSVFADHGEEFLEHADFSHQWGHDPRGIHGIGHGHSQFQELLHVPWFAWGPDVPQGNRIKAPVSLLDLSPTLLDWLQLPPMPVHPALKGISGEWAQALSGKSVAGHVPTSTGEERLFLTEAIAYGPDVVSLKRGPWKLLAHRQGKPLALFHLVDDPVEKENRLEKEPAVAGELLEILAAWRASGTGATGEKKNQGPGGKESWDDMDDTIRQRLKDLGYSD